MFVDCVQVKDLEKIILLLTLIVDSVSVQTLVIVSQIILEDQQIFNGQPLETRLGSK